MLLTLAHIGGTSAARDGSEPLVQAYLARCSGFARCTTEHYKSEAAFLEWIGRQQGRTLPVVVLFDSRGRQMSSESFATWIGAERDAGAQQIVFAIGPADGWSDAGLKAARLKLSLGPMTLAHSLARLVVAEQIYRAYAILSGHPYHCGH